MQIKIEKIVYPGKSLGRGADGVATFTEGCLPGEVVEVNIVRDKKTFRLAETVKIIENSPERIVPGCPFENQCGGCSFQYTGYENQLQIKHKYVNELLSPFAVAVPPVIRSPEIWNYRNKMEFSFFKENGRLSIGLHRKGKFDSFVSTPGCFIADKDFLPVVETVLEFAGNSGLECYDKKTKKGFWRHLVIRKAATRILVNIITGYKDDIPPDFFKPLINGLKDRAVSLFRTINNKNFDFDSGSNPRLIYGNETIEEVISVKDKKYLFTISPFSFFQTNTRASEKLYETVIDMLKPREKDNIIDFYCGVGTLGIILSSYAGSVLGIEDIAYAVEDAVYNKKINRIKNITFENMCVEKWSNGHRGIRRYNTFIFDPPRSGLSKEIIDFVINARPEKIVYVSCDPATFARDLKYLRDKSGYRVSNIAVVDMFPHTYHIEVIAFLTGR
ncbi:MAG: 23S rRNA (uracil(1939)-C(5))-methyltransferase RlmD [Elusimicrobia bacterium CG_4_10_14_0_8_um_filter_37_32]|nr:MAG: 23S rRNA (uracil(1939)-C(5))-methyltransferase RlmD [Elusimicrobia bacterium CG_4_10_14_0_8_um_filter_37_32]